LVFSTPAGCMINTSRVMSTLVHAACLRPTFRQIYLIINQSNRKYLTCAQQATESLFITPTKLKGTTEEKKKTVVEQLYSPDCVRQSDGWIGVTGI